MLARGAKFYFITKQDIPKEEYGMWEDTLSRSSPLSSWFGEVRFEYSYHPALIRDWQGWNLIKVFCTNAHISIEPSEAKSFYEEIFVGFSEWFLMLCRDRRIECRPYDFRILFRLHPPESPGEFVPIPALHDISGKLVSPQSVLPNPPLTLADMLELAQEVVSRQKLEELLEYVERQRLTLYGDYGVRSEERWDICHFYTLIPGPSPSEEMETMQSLQGDLYHELILHSKDTVFADFKGIVGVLLTRLLHNGAIDSQKVEQIYGNPDDHFVTGQGHSRFAIRFDLEKLSPDSRVMRAVDVTKKAIQRELEGTPYSLYGAVSYTLTDGDLGRIEAVLDDIVYFRKASRDALYVRLSILLVVNDYERAIGVARKTDEVINSHMVFDLNASRPIPTDIEDAKKRWESAASELARGGSKVTSYLFRRDVSAIPLQTFLGAREPMYEELSRIAEWAHIGTTITSDSFPHDRYGCYVVGS